jgi:hypothetical protein
VTSALEYVPLCFAVKSFASFLTDRPELSAVGSPQRYKRALELAGSNILSERNRRDFALAYFADLKARAMAAGELAPLGLHTLMGERRQDQIKNMIASISTGIITPVELIARKAH